MPRRLLARVACVGGADDLTVLAVLCAGLFAGAAVYVTAVEHPARLSCGESRFDTTRHAIVIDYSETDQIEGYRAVPDKIAGKEGLNIRDEVRMVRPGFFLGRAYFGPRLGLNFTLLDPVAAAASGAVAGPMAHVQDDCGDTK